MDIKNFSRELAHPVTLVSCKSGNQENLVTVAWAVPVSFSPPLLAVSVSPKRFSHQLLAESQEFTVIVLADSQKQLSTLAGTKSGRDLNKWELPEFADIRLDGKKVATAGLKGALANLECQKINQVTAGDHTLFIGEVVYYEADDNQSPLILFRRNYHSLGELIARYP
ncbi:MAG: flavin reductase family protein [Calditrichia bacterium]